MPLVKFKASKMSNAKVSHISLVERGANRIPFKIVKQEKDMSKFAGLDLGGLFTKKAESKPVVVGVVTMKGESFDSIKQQIEAAGFEVSNMEEAADGSVIFKQGEETEGDVVIKLNEHVGVVMKGFSPYNMDITQNGTTFADVCAAKGFYPGINTIMETLGDAVRSEVYAAKSPSDAKSAVSKLFSEAAAYTASFLASLPVAAFKLEKVEVETKADEGQEAGEGEAGGEAGGEAAGEAGGEGGEEDVSKKEKKPDAQGATGNAEGANSDEDPMKKKKCGEGEGSEEGDQNTEAKKDEAPGLTLDQVSSIVATQVSKALADSMTPLAATMAEVTKSLKSVSDTVGELNGRIEATEQIAKAAKEAVAGTTVVGGEGGDHVPSTSKKSETREFADIDTAFSPKRKFPGR